MIELWNVVFLQPIINGLLIVSHAFGNSFGLAIIVLTIIINVALLPLTLRQTRSTTAMQSVQPKLNELKAKYGKDKVKLQQETMKLYKEAGINPLGCIFPLLVQFPVWIALYQSLMHALATTPERLLALSQRLYAWPAVQQAVPPERHFLWMDLSQPDIPVTVLIVASTWLTLKMTAMPSTDPKQQQMNKMMQWMMPLMMGFIFLNFPIPSGLALYIVVMNVFRMAVQYFVGGWGGLATLLPARVPFGNQKAKEWTPPGKGWTPSDKTAKEIETAARKSRITPTAGEGTKDGSSRSKRKNRRRSRRTRS
ncbi:YidC/Oxa1 family membrane protein insertase [Dehalococcoidia bacterium]|nr:YidC/Oxa1 family membrane protein insertase [Dehalococcoidia bacterium]